MKQQIEQRLQTLKDEFASGQQVMAELEQKQTDLQHTLLRIGGAIQVLEELLNEAAGQGDEVSAAPDSDEAQAVAAVRTMMPAT